MMRFATYMIGVVLLVVAVWLVLTTLDVIAVLPATIIAAILLFVLGLGVIGASRRAPLPALATLAVLAVLPLFASALAPAQGSAPSDVAAHSHTTGDEVHHSHATCGEHDLPVLEVDADGINAQLRALFAVYEDLPGFLDVYYDGPLTPFRGVFIDAVPPAASARTVGVPIVFEAIPPLVPLGPGATPTVGDLTCQGFIRPGALVNGGCTLSFVFADATKTYVSTAGHCVDEGDRARLPGVGEFGTVVFSTGSGGAGSDFALIQVDAAKVALVTPEMCSVAGPSAAFTGSLLNGRLIVHTGHGQGVGFNGPTPPRPRLGVGVGWGAQSFSFFGAGIPGDSGSAVRTGGTAPSVALALGTLTHLGCCPTNFGTTLGRGLELAAAAGFTGLQLQTVPYIHGV